MIFQRLQPLLLLLQKFTLNKNDTTMPESTKVIDPVKIMPLCRQSTKDLQTFL